jgi:hypothetical protein
MRPTTSPALLLAPLVLLLAADPASAAPAARPTVEPALRPRASLGVTTGVGMGGSCLISTTATERTPCQYLLGLEGSLRPTAASRLRLLAGARAAAYIAEYPGATFPRADIYTTTGWEGTLGAALEVLRLRSTESIELFGDIGRGSGDTTHERNDGHMLFTMGGDIPTDYWLADVGAQWVHAGSGGLFVQARVAATVVGFRPVPPTSSLRGAAFALPRGEILVGLSF